MLTRIGVFTREQAWHVARLVRAGAPFADAIVEVMADAPRDEVTGLPLMADAARVDRAVAEWERGGCPLVGAPVLLS